MPLSWSDIAVSAISALVGWVVARLLNSSVKNVIEDIQLIRGGQIREEELQELLLVQSAQRTNRGQDPELVLADIRRLVDHYFSTDG